MPETKKYLKDNDWFEMEGYNKVFENSFPNGMAFLTGFNQSDAKLICKPEEMYGLDNCPMIWKLFEEGGYATAYGEDEPEMATFNWRKKGFVNPPTDYYEKPAMDAAVKFLKAKEKSGLSLCHGFKFAAEYISDYGIDYAELYKGRPYFGFFWVNSFSHNELSDPSGMDLWMASKLREIERKGILEDSIVIFMADHGLRVGEIQKLEIIQYEDRLPMMHFSLPKQFQREHPEIVKNLRINKNRLTNHYDLHMTLKHILQLSGRAPANVTGATGCPKCRSLFEEIPLNRCCEDTGIPDRWCTCNKYIPKY